ncbi:MAG: hypothetical protein IKK33_01745 [Lachnospiraceae bacterium]|nr:hypothetical protein [Lachnospiraceae bacterium]
MTKGELLFYGGIMGIVVFSILFVTCLIHYNSKKKKMAKQAEEELVA